VCCPLGEHQTVPAALQRRHDVDDHLLGAGVVLNEIAVDSGDPPGADGLASPV
jgi:hypothetical protein